MQKSFAVSIKLIPLHD